MTEVPRNSERDAAFAPQPSQKDASPTPFKRFIDHVTERQSVKRNADGSYTTRCRAHDDRTPSLTIYEHEDGSAWPKCFAGCDAGEVCEKFDYRYEDLFPRQLKRPAKRDPASTSDSPKPAREAPEPLWTDVELIAAADRLRADSEFRIRLVKERGWSPAVIAAYGLGLDGERRVVIPIRNARGDLLNVERYDALGQRKPKTLALARRPRELLLPSDGVPPEIFIFEGFADALAAASWDVPAIGVPSANWQDRWANVLRALGVTKANVVGDCDAPSRAYTLVAVKSLTAAGIEARAIDLDPSRSDKFDATDLFLELGQDAPGRLAQLVDETPSQLAVLSIDACRLLDETTAYLRRRIWLPHAEQYWTLALWIGHSHTIKAADATPYIEINSPQKGCGKTLALEVLALLVRNPWHTNSTSEAALFRKIQLETPTLLLDEIDAIFASASERTEPLRAILNSGNRPGVTVTRCVGREHEVAEFAVFCPKALAGIDTGRLPDTIRDRSITIKMQRLGPGESIERATGARRRTLEASARRIHARWVAWSETVPEFLRAIELDDIDELSPRSFDSWEPLLDIAQFAGEEWPERARRAALALSAGAAVEDQSAAVVLLRAVRRIFGDRGIVATDDLLRHLNEDESLRFGGWNHGHGMNGRDIARQLKPYGIKPRTVRIADTTPKGYHRDQFVDAWARYLPSATNPPHENPREMGDVADVADVAAPADRAENGRSNGRAHQPNDVSDFMRVRTEDSAR